MTIRVPQPQAGAGHSAPRPSPGGHVNDERLKGNAGLAEKGLTIRLFEPKDESAVLELLGAAFGVWPREGIDGARSEFFRWKHLEGPFGRSLMVVVELDGSVVGFYAYMPWLLSAPGRTIATLRAVDLAIDRRHRRLGISLALRSAVEFSSDVEFVWGNPNDASAGGGRRLGRPEVSGLRSFVRPCPRVIKALRPSRRRPARRSPAERPSALATAALALQDQTLLDRLRLPAEQDGERLATLKHEDYLRWRYGRWSSYHAVSADSPGDGALAIFRRRSAGRFVVADVGEMLLERRDPSLERRLLGRVAQAAAADFVLCNFSSLPAALSRGMLAYRTKETLMALLLREQPQLDPSAPDSWALSRGDLELL